MAQITIEELFWGKAYSIHDKANMAYAKRLAQRVYSATDCQV